MNAHTPGPDLQHQAVIRQCVDLFYSQQGSVAELLHRVAFAAYNAGKQAAITKATGGAAGGAA